MGKLFDISEFRGFSSTYIETGACYGESLRRAKKAGFTTLKSVELHEPFYNHVKKRYPEVDLYFGKSQDRLKEMLEDVMGPAVIFLDAHPAGKGTGGHEELRSGDQSFSQDSIIKSELSILLNHRPDHLIIIDDLNGDTYYQDLLPDYTFEWYDEHLAPDQPLFQDKLMVCRPA